MISGESHQQELFPLMYDECLRVFLDRGYYLNGMCEMEPPKAIDTMFSYFAVVYDPRRQHPTTLLSLEAILTMDQEVVRGYDAQGDGGHGHIEIRQMG
jgi:hypothetical protein